MAECPSELRFNGLGLVGDFETGVPMASEEVVEDWRKETPTRSPSAPPLSAGRTRWLYFEFVEPDMNHIEHERGVKLRRGLYE